MSFKHWFCGKKKNVSQILEKEGRISHLEKKIIRQGRMIREIQERMNRFWVQVQKLRAEMPKKH